MASKRLRNLIMTAHTSRPDDSDRRTPLGHRHVLLLLAVLFWCQSGCVHRRLTIRSNPVGALVYVDGVEIGRTPVSTPFVYYGTRTIRLELDGYETVEEDHQIRAPWYQVPPLDFVSDNLMMREIQDERALHFNLVPMQVIPRKALMQRADELRKNSQQGIVAASPNIAWNESPPFTPPLEPPSQPVLTPANPPSLEPSSTQIFAPPSSSPAWQYPGTIPGSSRTTLQTRLPSVQGSP